MTVNNLYWSQVDMTPRPKGTQDPHYHELRNFWVFVRDNDRDNAEEFLKRFPGSVTAAIRANDGDEGAPGDQAIHIAAHTGRPDMIDFLLSKGAGVDDANPTNGKTPLMAAAMSGKAEAVELLLKKGANTETRDFDGCTALWNAARFGHELAAKALLLGGADIEAAPRESRSTPLLAAIEGHNDWTAIFLLEQRAKTHVADSEGNTPFSLIAGRGIENGTRRRLRELLTQRSAEEQEGERVFLERQRQELIEEITAAVHTPVDMRGKTMAPLRLR